MATPIKDDDRRTDENYMTRCLELARDAAAAGDGAVLYCSLEPWFMCAGALLHARVDRVVFATADPKFGACGSLAHLPSDPRLNHRCPVDAGILAEESAILMREFFQRLR